MIQVTAHPSLRSLLSLGLGAVLLGGATAVAAQDAPPALNTRVEAVRQGTVPFPDPAAADAESFGLMFGCVSSPQDGARGRPSLIPALVGGGPLNAAHPEALLYDALQDGELRVVSVEFLVLAEE